MQDFNPMTKKGIISSVFVLAIVGIGITILCGDRCNKSSIETSGPVKKGVVQVNVTELHKDILRLIVEKKETVCGISPDVAEQELLGRAGNAPEFDSVNADVKTLPFDIVRLIAKSPATIAGIRPKQAINELVRRYLSIDLTDSDDVNSSILLEALQHRGEQKAIDEWAKNEDAEAVEAFMKEQADADPSSIANFALGLKKLDSEHNVAMGYFERFSSHVHSDPFDSPDEEAAYNELIDAVKKLK